MLLYVPGKSTSKLIHDDVCHLIFLYVLLFDKIGIDDYTAIGVSTHHLVC